MELDRICTIEYLLTPKSNSDIQLLLGFTNFYGRFIQIYAKVTLPLTEILEKSNTSPGKISECSVKWESTSEVELGFRKLTRTFTAAVVLPYSDLGQPIIL